MILLLRKLLCSVKVLSSLLEIYIKYNLQSSQLFPQVPNIYVCMYSNYNFTLLLLANLIVIGILESLSRGLVAVFMLGCVLEPWTCIHRNVHKYTYRDVNVYAAVLWNRLIGQSHSCQLSLASWGSYLFTRIFLRKRIKSLYFWVGD